MLLTPNSVADDSAPSTAVHPFLIVRREDFAELRARADRWPWSEQKAATLDAIQTERYCPDASVQAKAIVLARIFSTTALAYILDPDRRAFYVRRVVEHLRAFDAVEPGSLMAAILGNADKTLWNYAVPIGNAYFQAVLALDVVHDDLPPAERAAVMAMLRDGPGRYFRETRLAWTQGTLAAAAILPLYEGDAATYGPIVQAWREHTLKAISADGVFVGGCAYAAARWTYADRENKALFGEVLAHAGVLPDWYAERQVCRLQEWLNGYAYTPVRVLWSFGDAGPDRFDPQYQPGAERAYRYSAVAGGHAAWLRDGFAPPAGLASYVLAAEPPAAPVAAPSRVFPDGGAWLKETSLDPQSLAAVLWNARSGGDAHAHKETNAVGLAAYGEQLLRNGGYNGWATPEQGFSWDYIHDRAIAGNVVLFDYAVPATPEQERSPSPVNDHAGRSGGGITASLLTGVVDFARGVSGDAIPNGRHERDLLFVHPTPDAHGYYVVIDDMTAAPGATAHVVWHPAAEECTVRAERAEYDWSVREIGANDVGLSLFLATPPEDVHLRTGILANWDFGVMGKYLVGNYKLDASGRGRVVTILFPYDRTHAKAEIERLGHGGAVVRQGGGTDYVFACDCEEPGVRPSVVPGLTLQAKAGYVRFDTAGRRTALWASDATRVLADGFDFEATAPVTLHCTPEAVRLTLSTATEVRLSVGGRVLSAVGEATDGMRVANQLGLTVSRCADTVFMRLTAGTHAFSLV